MSERFQRAVVACLVIICGGLVAAMGVSPDVRFESKTEIKLGGTLGTAAKFLGFTKPGKTTTQLKGDVLRIDEGKTSEIIDLDQEDYTYALVCGPDRKYLWILARQKILDDTVVQKLVTKAKALGFDTDSLIFVDHQD